MSDKIFDTIVADIKELRIQGAANVAEKGLEAIYEKSKTLTQKKDLDRYIEILKKTRITEPALRNVLALFKKNVSDDLSDAEKVYETIYKNIMSIAFKIKEYGANVIENGMILFTHCHSSHVVNIMLEAHKQGKKFEVYNSETRPRFQGRITAQELADNGIIVHHMVDSVGYTMLKKSDIFFFGADSIGSYGNVFNKVGTKMFAEIAEQYDVKTFCAASSLKFNKESINGNHEHCEERSEHEVWNIQHKNIIIHNPAFDEVEKEHIDAIISEFGVLSPESFVTKVTEMLE